MFSNEAERSMIIDASSGEAPNDEDTQKLYAITILFRNFVDKNGSSSADEHARKLTSTSGCAQNLFLVLASTSWVLFGSNRT